MESPDPAYVFVPTLAQTLDDDYRRETQAPVCRFREVAENAPPCSATGDSKRFRCNKSKTGDPRTLLVAYLPRRASTEEVRGVFGRFGSVCSANIVRDEDGRSKCFGFVQFENHAAAAGALQACYDGRVMLEGEGFKAWHLKASWARAEQLKGERPAALGGRSARRDRQTAASRAAVGCAAEGSGSTHGSKKKTAHRRVPLPPGLVLNNSV